MPAIGGALALSRTAGDCSASPHSGRRFHGRALPRPHAEPFGSGRKAARELQSIPGENRIVHRRPPLSKGFLTSVCVLHIGKMETRLSLFMLVPLTNGELKSLLPLQNRSDKAARQWISSQPALSIAPLSIGSTI